MLEGRDNRNNSISGAIEAVTKRSNMAGEGAREAVKKQEQRYWMGQGRC